MASASISYRYAMNWTLWFPIRPVSEIYAILIKPLGSTVMKDAYVSSASSKATVPHDISGVSYKTVVIDARSTMVTASCPIVCTIGSL